MKVDVARQRSTKLIKSPFTTIEQGLKNLYDRIERMRGLGPEFVDITW